MKWLTRGNISINLCGAHRRKVYGSAAYLLNSGKLFILGLTDPITSIYEAMSGVEHPASATHRSDALACFLRGVRFAIGDRFKLKD